MLLSLVQTINSYLSDYVLVILLLGVGLWYSIRTGFVSYILNTRSIFSREHYDDGRAIRECAVQNGVNTFTSLDTARIVTEVLEEMTISVSTINAE